MKKTIQRCKALAAFMFGIGILTQGTAWAADDSAWPTKPITWIVGFGAGGSADAVSRLVAQRLEQKLGQPIVIENRTGASGSIALRAAATATPDGYTIVTMPGPVITETPMPKLGGELTAVSELARGPMVLVGTMANAMPDDIKALLADLKSNPEKYEYASSGNGTSQHLWGELIKQETGLNMVHIPYKGGNQAAMDVIGGQTSLGVLGITSVLPHIQSGKLKAYAVSTADRNAALPDVPSLSETSVAGLDASQWFILATTAGVPAGRIEKLNAMVAEILAEPKIIEGFANVGVVPSIASADDASKFVIGEQSRWQELATQNKLLLN
jgi:tripartite-type tricarboxylate transporter receptor subunit TctC